MPINIHGKEYKTVAERVNEFYTKYAGFTRSIVTEILKESRYRIVLMLMYSHCWELATLKKTEGRVGSTTLLHWRTLKHLQ